MCGRALAGCVLLEVFGFGPIGRIEAWKLSGLSPTSDRPRSNKHTFATAKRLQIEVKKYCSFFAIFHISCEW